MRTFSLFFALGLLACILPARRCLGQSSSRIHSDRFVYRLPTIRSRNATAQNYIRFTDRFLAIKDTKEATNLALNTFQDIRRSGDLVDENIFVSKMTYLIPDDTTLIPLAVSMMDQLVIDNDSLLPRMADKELQRGVINQMAETACTYLYVRRADISIPYESMAIRLNERLHQHATFPYQNLSFLYTTRGRLKDALVLALDAMRVAETPAGVVDAAGYESLARVYFMTGDFDKCAEFSEKAFALYVKDPSKVEYTGVLLFRYVQVLLQQQKADEALRFLRSLDGPLSNAQPDDGDKANWALSMAECFRVLHQADSAERYYTKTLALKPPFSSSWFRISTDVCLATFYSENGRYVQAGRLLDTLLGNLLRNALSTMYLERALLLRYRVDSALGNYPRAMADLRQYQQIHDSLTNFRLNKQLADLTVRSETEKTAQHISDLEKQSLLQTRLQQSTLHQERLVRNYLIAGAALLAIFAVILYSRWRTRRRMALRLEKLAARQQKLLGEKEWLLREIHHRVKNNLQIIISLLNMQAGQLKDEIAISAFEEIGARVNTISLVHKKLYQETQDMASINMQDFVRELVSFLQEGLSSRQAIAFNLDIQELILDPSQCVPLGLILNESITNAIKYAFRENIPSPSITICLKEEPENSITLVITDNGIGLPAGFNPANSKTLGFHLIQTLTLQLEGTLEMTSAAAVTPATEGVNPTAAAITPEAAAIKPATAALKPEAAAPASASVAPASIAAATFTPAAAPRGLTVTICFPWLEPMTTVHSAYATKSITRHPAGE